jgi:pilus assembly protein FimV
VSDGYGVDGGGTASGAESTVEAVDYFTEEDSANDIDVTGPQSGTAGSTGAAPATAGASGTAGAPGTGGAGRPLGTAGATGPSGTGGAGRPLGTAGATGPAGTGGASQTSGATRPSGAAGAGAGGAGRPGSVGPNVGGGSPKPGAPSAGAGGVPRPDLPTAPGPQQFVPPAAQAPQSFYGSPPPESPLDDDYSGSLPALDVLPPQVTEKHLDTCMVKEEYKGTVSRDGFGF